VDGAPVRGIDDLQRLLTAERIDMATDVEVVREGDLRHLQLTPRELPTGQARG
jgi:S1-C subfamily serine protease